MSSSCQSKSVGYNSYRDHTCTTLTSCTCASSTSSEKSCSQPCQNLCKTPREPEVFNAKQLYKKYQDAIVTIKAMSAVTVLFTPPPPVGPGPIPIDELYNITYIKTGSGFFIKGSYIVTSAANVLLLPDETVTFVSPLNETIKTGNVIDHLPLYAGQPSPSTSIRADRIFVQVLPTIQPSRLVMYEAKIVAMDMAGDIALLQIKPCDEWNKCNPCLDCQNYLSWGNSNCAAPGSNAFVYGAVDNQNEPEIFQTKVRDNHYVDTTGKYVQELIALDEYMSEGLRGAPILDNQGCIIGMVTRTVTSLDVTSDISFGPTECFISRVLKHLFEALVVCDKNYNKYLEWVNDPAGGFYRYVKGFIGFSYHTATGTDYIQPPLPVEAVTIESTTTITLAPVCDSSVSEKLADCVCEGPKNAFEISPFVALCPCNDNTCDTTACISNQTTITNYSQPRTMTGDANVYGFATYFRSASNVCFLKGGINGIVIDNFYGFHDGTATAYANVIVYPKGCPHSSNGACNDCSSSSSSSSSSSKFRATSSTATDGSVPFSEYVLQINDIITHINDRPIGTFDGQIPPSAVTWFLVPQKGLETVDSGCPASTESSSSTCCSTATVAIPPVYTKITYRKYADCNECTGAPQAYVNSYEGLVRLNRYPLVLDIPATIILDANPFQYV